MSQENPNDDICKYLIEIGIRERDETGLIYKFHAYNKAAKALESYGKRVESGAEAQKLNGIGPKIALRIDEYLKENNGMAPTAEGTNKKEKEGKPKKETKKKDQKEKKKRKRGKEDSGETSESTKSSEYDDYLLIDHYQKFYGMTKNNVMKLKSDGIITVGDLKNNKKALDKNDAQLICLEHFDDLCKKIPRKEIKKFEKVLLGEFQKSKEFHVELCGPYRRNASECDAIEVLIVALKLKSSDDDFKQQLRKTMKMIGKNLTTKKIIKAQIALEDSGFVVMVQPTTDEKSSPFRRMNVHVVASDQYIPALFHLTGSQSFYEKARLRALDNGFLLTDKSLCKIGFTCVTGMPIHLKSEEELFNYIDYPYTEPDQRNSGDDADDDKGN